MKDDTYKHEIFGKIGNRDNQFRTNVGTNLNSYLNEKSTFPKPFSTIVLRDKTKFSYRDH